MRELPGILQLKATEYRLNSTERAVAWQLIQTMRERRIKEPDIIEFCNSFLARDLPLPQPRLNAKTLPLSTEEQEHIRAAKQHFSEDTPSSGSNTDTISYAEVVHLQHSLSQCRHINADDAAHLKEQLAKIRLKAAFAMFQHIAESEPGLFTVITDFVMTNSSHIDTERTKYYTDICRCHGVVAYTARSHRNIQHINSRAGTTIGYRADFYCLVIRPRDNTKAWLAVRANYDNDGNFIDANRAYKTAALPFLADASIEAGLSDAQQHLSTPPRIEVEPAPATKPAPAAHTRAPHARETMHATVRAAAPTARPVKHPIKAAIRAAFDNYKKERNNMWLPNIMRQHGLYRATFLRSTFEADDNTASLRFLLTHLSRSEIDKWSSVGLTDNSFETHLVYQLLRIFPIETKPELKTSFATFIANSNKDTRQEIRKQLAGAIKSLLSAQAIYTPSSDSPAARLSKATT